MIMRWATHGGEVVLMISTGMSQASARDSGESADAVVRTDADM